MEQNNKTINEAHLKQLTLIIIGILIGLIAGYFFFKDRAPIDDLVSTEKGDEVADDLSLDLTSQTADTLITVKDQAPGEIVLVDTVAIKDKPFWLVIYTDNAGEPASIFGAQYFGANNNTNLKLELQAGTLADETYHLVIHQDDGKIVESKFGTHEFDLNLDKPLINSTGKKISTSFKTLSIGARGI